MSAVVVSDLISIFIPTRNEEIHIERCIKSANRLTSNIYVVDSNSFDRTREIAEKLGACVYSGEFSSFSHKLNWGIDNVAWTTPWVLRLDADEVLTDDLVETLHNYLAKAGPEVNGFYLRRQLWFMGSWIKYGGMYPTYTMRLWRNGFARSEMRHIDEHMILLSGVAVTLNLDIVDNPLTSVASWIDKHNYYSTVEVLSISTRQDQLSSEVMLPRFFGGKVERVRWIKLKLFYRLPLFVRPLLYFLYRYFFRCGFLDGREGFLFHFMHGLWYRVLVDAKLFEQRKNP